MKKGIMWMRKSVPLTLLALVLSVVITSLGTASPVPTIAQANPATTVYLDPPTINGTMIGQEFNVSILIRDGQNIYAWQAGLTFNPDLLECIDFYEGEFLKDVSLERVFVNGTINNTAGVIMRPYSCSFLAEVPGATGDGRLAYATFKVKTLGVSDIHLRDVRVLKFALPPKPIPVKIIDIYTVVLGTTVHTVVTVSNSTILQTGFLGAGFYGHSFNLTLEEISFNVAGPNPSFSNVTIPKDLLPPPVSPRVWAAVINSTTRIFEAPTENETHTSLYFTYPAGVNEVHITTRFMPSTILIALSGKSISLGESVTISGKVTGADDNVRANVNVTILKKTSDAKKWDTLAKVKTDQNGEYTHEWTPEKTGTYEIKASWPGDLETLPAESDVLTFKVKGAEGIPLEIVAIVVVVIIVILAAVVYFVKIRKSKTK